MELIDKVILKIDREINFACMRALNATVADMALFRYPNLVQEVFDRPTPYIMRGFKYRKAEKDNLTAEIYADDFIGPTPQKVLASEVFGGARKPKRFELALRAKGILPQDQFAAPGKDAKIDAYGNMSFGLLTQIISALGAYTEMGFMANRTKRLKKPIALDLFVINRVGRKEDWFGGREGHITGIGNRLQGLPMGIYQRVGAHGIKQLVKFVKQPVYEQRFKFFDEGNRLIPKLFEYNFHRFFQE